jgi:ATP-dependent Clp protease ATP-binding subunit ClpA
MFERFTDRSRRVVILAQEEARMLDHNYVGPEHVLLGLVHEGQGVAARALTELDISLSAVREQVEELIGRGQQAPSGHIPFTPRAKKVLELSLREALQLGHNYIGTEHILLGILREGDSVAAQVLVRMGTDLNRVRLEVIKLVGSEAEVIKLVGSEAEAISPGEIRTPPGETRTRPREIRTARSTVSHDPLLAEVRNALVAMADRLTAIERHLGMTAGAAEDSGGAADDKPAGAQPDDAPGDERPDRPEDPPGDVRATGE